MTDINSEAKKIPLDEIQGDLFALIDGFLDDIKNQRLVDSSQVMNFCLDLRNIISRGNQKV